jgi:DNA-binding transcriptional LysR family regulator
MDWDDLRIFLAVARAESLSGAGRSLKIDPATVGRRIARLEEAIGARLFSKTPQGYSLTDQGTRLIAHAERTETAIEGARDSLAGPEGLTGQPSHSGPVDGAKADRLPASPCCQP